MPGWTFLPSQPVLFSFDGQERMNAHPTSPPWFRNKAQPNSTTASTFEDCWSRSVMHRRREGPPNTAKCSSTPSAEKPDAGKANCDDHRENYGVLYCRRTVFIAKKPSKNARFSLFHGISSVSRGMCWRPIH